MSEFIKKTISIALVAALSALTFSCKSLDPKLVEQTSAFDKGVNPMRVVINTDSIKACFHGGWRDDYEMLLEWRKWRDGYSREYPGIKGYSCCSFPDQESAVRIIRNNLMFDRDSRNAYLSVLVRNVEWSTNPGWMVPGSITVGILYFMGMPGVSITLTIDLEAAVMKPDGRVLKVYRAKGVDTEYLAFYWGYAKPDIPAFMNALIAGCADLRKKIEDDKDNLNKLIR
ncbi:MAG: hypothetical protein MUD12_17175 [Spirochaetes bacterium]|jgi:hypothetical protein|nr:hypothetical protein [Spirochaetota bacterium]